MAEPVRLVPKQRSQIPDAERDLELTWQQAEIAAADGDHRTLLHLWKRLDQLGIWRATARIGELYELGTTEGIDKNVAEAIIWYRKAVFSGDDPVAHLGLGRIYFSGCDAAGVDLTKSRTHLLKAFEGGLPQAGVYLGQMSMFGMSAPMDAEEAFRFFMAAADGRFPIAYRYLAALEAQRGRLRQALRMRALGKILEIRLMLEDWNHQARAGGTRYIFASPGLASHRRCPVSSNVRPQKHSPALSSLP
jgi:TPR repeat protein